MLIFLIFILSTIGSTFIITHSYLFRHIRKKTEKLNPTLGKLFKCPQCAGFYMGIICQLIILFKERMELVVYFSDFYYILYGFIGSFVCYLVYLLIKPLIDKYD